MRIKVIFIFIFITNLMINMDHGILPAATKELRADFGVTNSQLGFMGSIVYLGLAIGKLKLSSS
jgi:MFS transporter, Spinster family, sphingosine-1-phosphate transporter